jgi:hypothetical protein
MYYYLVKYNGRIIGAYTTKEEAELFINACYQNNFMVDNASIVYCSENSCYFVKEVNVPRDAPYKNSTLVHDNKTRKLFDSANIFLSSIDNCAGFTSEKLSSDIVTTDINMVSSNSPKNVKLDYLHESGTDYETSDEYPNITFKRHTSCATVSEDKTSDIKTSQDITVKPEEVPVNIFATPEYIKQTEERTKLQHEINILKMKKAKLEQSKKVYDTDLNIYNTFKKCSTVVPEIFKKKYDIFKKLEDKNELSWENFISEYSHENMYNDHFNVTYHEAKVIETNSNKEFDNLDTFEIDTDNTTDEN